MHDAEATWLAEPNCLYLKRLVDLDCGTTNDRRRPREMSATNDVPLYVVYNGACAMSTCVSV